VTWHTALQRITKQRIYSTLFMFCTFWFVSLYYWGFRINMRYCWRRYTNCISSGRRRQDSSEKYRVQLIKRPRPLSTARHDSFNLAHVRAASQLVTWPTRHTVNSSHCISQLVKRSTRHTVNSSQTS